MNTRYIATEYRLAHWAGILGERKDSGLNIKQFCEEKGIAPNVYFYWQRRLREVAAKELMKPETEAGLAPRGWALCAAEKPASAPSVTIEIGKCRITAHAGVDTELLTSVCRALSEIC